MARRFVRLLSVAAVSAALLVLLFGPCCPCTGPMASSEHSCCAPAAGIRAVSSDCCTRETLSAPMVAKPETRSVLGLAAPVQVLPVASAPVEAPVPALSFHTPTPPPLVLRI